MRLREAARNVSLAFSMAGVVVASPSSLSAMAPPAAAPPAATAPSLPQPPSHPSVASPPPSSPHGPVSAASRPPPVAQAGDAIPDAATRRMVLAQSYAYFAAKDDGRYDAAYAWFAPSVRAYLAPDLYRAQTAEFNAAAGKGERRIVTLTWERDPPEAPVPGLYVAADFVSRFANLRLHCGYLMWHREADGTFRIVREEQSFLDNAAASRLTPERLRPLPREFGCPGATAALE